MRVEEPAGQKVENQNAFESLLTIRNDGPRRESERSVWNVRAVGFISKPKRTDDLALCIENSVNELLREFPGFSGAIVLHSQDEKRNLLVLSFWQTESQAATTRWERSRAVRKAISPMIDVCTKVQTFRATASAAFCGMSNHKPGGVC